MNQSASALQAARPKVLVVDDQPANRIAASTILSTLPVEVFTASSGDEALGLILRHEFAVILLDVRMPGMDGYETATLIRGHTERSPVPIIFVTAEANEQHAVFHGYESGAVDYLLKPIDEDLLRSKIRIFLELFRHRQQLAETASALRQSNQRLSRLLQAVGDGIIGVEADGSIGFANPAACRLLDIAPERLAGKPVRQLFVPAPAENAPDPFARAAAEGVYRDSEARFVSPQGHEFAVEYVLSAVESAQPQEPGSFVLVFQDITDRQLAEQQLRRQAELDHLTGLPNRRLFEQRLTKALARPGGRGRPFALLMLDLNGFKSVNDRHGHAVGDYLLKSVAARLRVSLRATDVAARLGGDEFAVLLEGTSEVSDALQIGQKTATLLSQPYECGGITLQVSAGIGVSLYPLHGQSMAALVQAADQAMYVAKRNATRRVVLAGAAPNEELAAQQARS